MHNLHSEGEMETFLDLKKFECPYCHKKFSKESTVMLHSCEMRRRFEDRNTMKVSLGFQAFQSIKKLYYSSSKNDPSAEEFRESKFYVACVRWGRLIIETRCFCPLIYLNWLIQRKVKVDLWGSLDIYDTWLYSYIFDEDAWKSLERSAETMSKWCEENNCPFEMYFSNEKRGNICHNIKYGLITGWVLLCSESGRKWLKSLEKNELDDIWEFIRADRWSSKFANREEDFHKISIMCKDLGL